MRSEECRGSFASVPPTTYGGPPLLFASKKEGYALRYFYKFHFFNRVADPKFSTLHFQFYSGTDKSVPYISAHFRAPKISTFHFQLSILKNACIFIYYMVYYECTNMNLSESRGTCSHIYCQKSRFGRKVLNNF